tara:strand:+ start:461 stop:718 length:258 start_codon:yes stop_codon:yes gene_type:complete
MDENQSRNFRILQLTKILNKMKSTLEEKMKYMRQEAESDMLYNRDRMYDNPDTDVTYYERRYSESKAYYRGIMDTLNLIAQDQAK